MLFKTRYFQMFIASEDSNKKAVVSFQGSPATVTAQKAGVHVRQPCSPQESLLIPQKLSWDILNVYENTWGRFKSLLQQCHGISFIHWSRSTLEEFVNTFGLRHMVWERHRWFYQRNKVQEKLKSSKAFIPLKRSLIKNSLLLFNP